MGDAILSLPAAVKTTLAVAALVVVALAGGTAHAAENGDGVGIGVGIGDEAPGWAFRYLTPIEGAGPAVPDLDGKVVVLDFWATWCGPCRESIPHLRELSEAFPPEQVVFLSISDEEASVVEPFAKKNAMPGIVVTDRDSVVGDLYGITSIPHVVVVDRKGIVRASLQPGAVTRGVVATVAAGEPLPPEYGEVPANLRMQPPIPEDDVVRVSVSPATSDRRDASVSARDISLVGLTPEEILVNTYQMTSVRIDAEIDLASQRYDVSIRHPEGSDRAALVEAALEAELGVSITRETKSADCVVLHDGGFDAPAVDETASPARTSVEAGQTLRIKGAAPFERLPAMLEAHYAKPVVDETGLEGAYDLDLSWKADDATDLSRALAEIGLRADIKSCETEFLVLR